MWEFYDHEIQILERFDSLKQAQDLEKRLIRPFLNHPNCLNEHCGGGFSFESSSRGGKQAVLVLQDWWRNASEETLEKQRRRSVESGRKTGQANVKSGWDQVFHTFRDPEERSDWGKSLAEATNSTQFQCPCCSKVCNMGGMTRHLSAKSNECSGEMITLKEWKNPKHD
jgi:hypothetical protein